ncbi:hypothetical protein [Lactobacillus hominis]|uniref:Phage protein n=1 Tax=Lactobacillus hominis DSM 23910 = CRBIP 24.179 TaxID=1423758 RepID=I7IVL2_9LACO|nr:hypothetical protein [Lactobacillus hominis]KRM85821.1 hypothetical protein FC41_GL000006 [Lactobacillus hominis DSM 23910 = CRBIP 24.179]MCT3348948.1 hypothetical protein [Lactobacillus hominis]CCI81638.1 Putative uncharacterized protein [Lactobacillus hominis DSM 23910 = CRBIP 24.179]
MAIKVNFDAKDTLGKNYELIDTYNNVKIVAQSLIDMLNAIDKEEKKNPDMNFIEYGELINRYVKKNVARILGLDAKGVKKLDNMSRSDVTKFYEELADKFCDMTVPSTERLKEAINSVNGQVPERDVSEKGNEQDPK